jgi:hypothetical protein
LTPIMIATESPVIRVGMLSGFNSSPVAASSIFLETEITRSALRPKMSLAEILKSVT